MSDADRVRWDRRYAQDAKNADSTFAQAELDAVFWPYRELFPTAGYALDLACGRGRAAVWLARRGLDVLGVDVSPVAIRQARRMARAAGVAARCVFEVADLDAGLPSSPDAAVIHCRRFRERRLDDAIVRRLVPGGLLALTALLAIDGVPTAFRVGANELRDAFAGLDLIAAGQDEIQAWVLARRPEGFS